MIDLLLTYLVVALGLKYLKDYGTVLEVPRKVQPWLFAGVLPMFALLEVIELIRIVVRRLKD